jgi:hypothetical protein
MLPDYPKAKEEFLSKLKDRFAKRSKRGTGPFQQAPVKPIYEGHNWRMKRADGSVDEDSLGKFEVGLKIKTKEIEEMGERSLPEVLKTFDKAADEMGKKLSKHFFGTLERITDELGSVVDGKGEPFSVEKFFEVLEKLEFDFKPNGEPDLPTIVANPKMLEQIKKELSKIESNPEHKARHDEIIEKKRQAWRARESSRKLVG